MDRYNLSRVKLGQEQYSALTEIKLHTPHRFLLIGGDAGITPKIPIRNTVVHG